MCLEFANADCEKLPFPAWCDDEGGHIVLERAKCDGNVSVRGPFGVSGPKSEVRRAHDKERPSLDPG
jgi:hypothetical protein